MQETASLSRIRPGKNPREFFDEAEMNELAESIRSYGVLQPILVRPAGDAGAVRDHRRRAPLPGGQGGVRRRLRDAHRGQGLRRWRCRSGGAHRKRPPRADVDRRGGQGGEAAPVPQQERSRRNRATTRLVARKTGQSARADGVFRHRPQGAHRTEDSRRPRRAAGGCAARHPGQRAQGHSRSQGPGGGAQGAVGQVRAQARRRDLRHRPVQRLSAQLGDAGGVVR